MSKKPSDWKPTKCKGCGIGFDPLFSGSWCSAKCEGTHSPCVGCGEKRGEKLILGIALGPTGNDYAICDACLNRMTIGQFVNQVVLADEVPHAARVARE